MSEDKRTLADESYDITESKAFQFAVRALRKRWFEEMVVMEPAAGSDYPLTCALACARIKALEAIPTELNRLMTDYKVELKRGR